MEASGTALVHPLLTLRKRRDLEQRRQIRTTQLTAQLAVAPPAQPEEEASHARRNSRIRSRLGALAAWK